MASNMAIKARSLQARRALEELGQNIRTARLKRRISVKGFAERAGVSESTIIRLEKGDNGVSIGTLSMACLVLGEVDRISDLLDPGSDDMGLLLDKQMLPKRIASKRKPDAQARRETTASQSFDYEDYDGVGF